MPEPITIAALITLLKAAGAGAVLGKVTLIIKGLFFTTKGTSILMLAKSALVAAQSYGIVQAGLMVAQMLLIIGTVASGGTAIALAIEALEAMKRGDFKTAEKNALKAVREASPAVKGWWPN